MLRISQKVQKGNIQKKVQNSFLLSSGELDQTLGNFKTTKKSKKTKEKN